MSLYAYFILKIPFMQGIPLTVLLATFIFDSYYNLNIQYGSMTMFIWLSVQLITLIIVIVAVLYNFLQTIDPSRFCNDEINEQEL